jgi:hypothetical protein
VGSVSQAPGTRKKAFVTETMARMIRKEVILMSDERINRRELPGTHSQELAST